ncbi:MAG TPA: hypothetical protein VKE98_14750 [Gemmataceae bacterium]|nr:hypothetical protein [Gemmataceae bacterium]
MDDNLFRSDSNQSRGSIARTLAWWIIAPIMGMIIGIIFGAVLFVPVLFAFSGEAVGIGTILTRTIVYLMLAGWFFAIVGFSVGIALAIHNTSNLTNKK